MGVIGVINVSGWPSIGAVWSTKTFQSNLVHDDVFDALKLHWLEIA